MATIGSLAVKLTLQAAEFSAGAVRAAKDLKSLQAAGQQVYMNTRTAGEKYAASVNLLNTLQKKGIIDKQTYYRALKQEKTALKEATGSSLAMIGAVSGVAAAVIGAAAAGYSWLKSLGKTVAEQAQLGRVLGLSQAEVAGLQMSLHNMGADESKAASGIQKMNDMITAGASGNLAAADAFDRIGLSAAQLANVPTGKGFSEIAKQIAGIEDPTKRAAAAVSIFGEDAIALLPALSKGEGGLAEAAELAKKLGIGLEDVKADSVEDASNRVDELIYTLKGIGTAIAAEVLPWITALADSFGGPSKAASTAGSVTRTVLKGIAVGVAFVVEGVQDLGIAWSFVKLGFELFAFAAIKGLQKILEIAGKLPDKLGGARFRKAAELAGNDADKMKGLMDDTMKEIDDKLAEKPAHVGVLEWFDELDRKAAESGKKMSGLKGAGGATAIAAKKMKLFQEAAGIFDRAKTPLQTFQGEMSKLNALSDAGAVSWDTYAKSAANALAALDKAHGMSEVHLAGAAQRDTTETYSAVVKARAQAEFRRETPEQKVARLLTQSAEIEKAQLAYQKQIAEALKKQNIKTVEMR